jgi:probable phosphoglycerate mutase
VSSDKAIKKLIIEADGGSRGNPGPAAYGAVVRDAASGQVVAERGQFLGEVTNNVAEYSGLVAGIEAALEISPSAFLDIRMDSRLVIQQMLGHWQIKHPDMRRLATRARRLLTEASATFTWVPRARNAHADRLVNEAIDTRSAIKRDFELVAPPPVAKILPDEDLPEDGRSELAEPEEKTGSRQVSETEVSADVEGPAEDDAPSELVAGPPEPLIQRLRRAGAGAQGTPSGRYVSFTRAKPTTVLLGRHAVTEATEGDGTTFSGTTVPGPPLSPRGREQAEALGALVDRVAMRGLWSDVDPPIALLTSPTLRTRETAAAVGDVIGLDAVPDYSFIEANFGEWDGLRATEVDERWPRAARRWFTDPDFRPPGDGESQNDVYLRVKRGLTRVVETYPVSTIVVISHTIAIRAALGVALGAPAQAWMRFRLTPASLTVMHFWPAGETEVLAQNWTLLDE